MIQKKTIILAVVLIAIVIIQLNDGLTRNEVREKFRCALQKRRFQLVTSSSTKEHNGQVTTDKSTTASDVLTTTTVAGTSTVVTTTATTVPTTTFSGPYKSEEACNKGNLFSYTNRIESKYF